ncbi:hypothetical protein RRG08_053041 [Elysia crispata]|uniref:Uncharacterized protein n=1 Tax=Elysia crispata TaxID=231223 RepID=A0AAE0XSD7_9GAST|nr:hypothetical protein RRG08_053041 [Elysia crispata]
MSVSRSLALSKPGDEHLGDRPGLCIGLKPQAAIVQSFNKLHSNVIFNCATLEQFNMLHSNVLSKCASVEQINMLHSNDLSKWTLQRFTKFSPSGATLDA